ncbi:MAG: hypothetical protein RSE41_00210 [Clostridia bacterium]
MATKHISKHENEFLDAVEFKKQQHGSGREAARKLRKKMAQSAKRKENESWKRNIEY